MISVEAFHSSSARFPLPRNFAPPSGKNHRHVGRSMRTVRSIFYQDENSCYFPANRSEFVSENLTESVVDMRLGELAAKYNSLNQPAKCPPSEELLDLSRSFSDFSSCSSDISGELQRLANLPSLESVQDGDNADHNPEPVPCPVFLQSANFSIELIESILPEDLLPTVKICIEGLQSTSVAVKQSAAANLRLLAKNRAENRALIGESGAIPALIPLLRCSDPWTQEHAVTALLNLSLHEENRILITKAGAVKSLVYVLKTGTETSKQNAACALLSLAMIEDNKSSIGACGAIPPLVSMLLNGSNRGKKDAITTLYKLCSIMPNKERVVNAGAVRPLVDMVCELGTGMAEKAMVVLNSLAAIEEGKVAIVGEGGIPALVEAIEDGSVKGKEFALMTLLQLCSSSVRNRVLLVREGGIPPLVALSQTGSIKSKHKAETLLGYLREPRREGSPSRPR